MYASLSYLPVFVTVSTAVEEEWSMAEQLGSVHLHSPEGLGRDSAAAVQGEFYGGTHRGYLNHILGIPRASVKTTEWAGTNVSGDLSFP